MKKHNAPTVALNVFLFTMSFIMIAPFLWILSTSLRLPNESFKLPPSFIPTSFHWQNYVDVFTVFPFLDCILNSVKVAIFSVGFNLIVSTMAGYAFARIPFKGRSFVFLAFLAGMMVPVQATLIPTYIVLSKIGLVGSHWSLILPAIISPLNIFFIRQYMMTIPGSYEEAAYIDGASRFRIYAQVFVPMSTSVIIMTSLLTFLSTWNSFLQPLVYLSKWDMMTLPLGLKTLNGMHNTGSVSVVLAGVTISLVVPTLLYAFGHKYILQGNVMSGLKS
jgi:multiple sugar transport system permease protein